MQQRSFLALAPHGFVRIAYTQWGDDAAPQTLICAHGLTRNSRDFDFVADALADRFRVVCPDMPGRGRSDRLTQPEDYQYPVYVQIAAALLAHLGADEVAWLGTSMGGLIGMMLAAQPGSPVRRLIVNDIGACIPGTALARIASYVGTTPAFSSLDEVERYLRQVHAPFGALTDEQWHHLAIHSARREDGGRWRLGYDPSIAVAFRPAGYQDLALWDLWHAVRCPTLILRGAESDVLLAETADRMCALHRGAQTAVIPAVGHAPMLMDAGQIGIVRGWLTGTETEPGARGLRGNPQGG